MAEFESIWARRKQALDEENAAADKGMPLGATPAMPQLSTIRTREALAAGGVDGVMPPQLLAGAGPPVMCKYFLRSGCAKGKLCPFSHEVASQPTVPIEQKLRTSCKFFELGSCMRGAACKFAHGSQEMSAIHTMMKTNAKKRGRDELEGASEAPKPEDAALMNSLSAAKGFQNFDAFDAASAGATAVEAKGSTQEAAATEPPAEGDGMDSMFAAFLAEVEQPRQSADEADEDDEKAGATAAAACEKAGWTLAEVEAAAAQCSFAESLRPAWQPEEEGAPSLHQQQPLSAESPAEASTVLPAAALFEAQKELLQVALPKSQAKSKHAGAGAHVVAPCALNSDAGANFVAPGGFWAACGNWAGGWNGW